jgi:amidohydrolase
MAYEQWVVEMRRRLHQYPELGNLEFNTADIIEHELQSLGIETKRLLPTGILGILRGTKPLLTQEGEKPATRVIALRADMDALEILEDTGLSYASKNEGRMHACGHDAHTAILLGVAKALSGKKNDLSDVVKFIFQPAEESTGGAERMIAEGCMKNPAVDYVFGLHVMPDITAGSIGIKYGRMFAASDMITITVNGVMGHGAFPDKAIDAVVVAAAIITNVQSIPSRNVSAANPCIITFGSIHGGTTNNVIANKVEIKGTIRTLDSDNRAFVQTRINEMVAGIASAMGAQAEITYQRGYNALINNTEAVDLVCAAASKLVGDTHIVHTPDAYMGGEDFSFYLEHAKGAFFGLGCGYPDKPNSGLHTTTFDLDEGCLSIGVDMLSSLIQ